jgi:hypothetical protein
MPLPVTRKLTLRGLGSINGPTTSRSSPGHAQTHDDVGEGFAAYFEVRVLVE